MPALHRLRITEESIQGFELPEVAVAMTNLDDEGTPAAPSLAISSEESIARFGEPPIEPVPPQVRVRERHLTAAGMPAIISTTKYGLRAMGPLKAVRAFLGVNKAKGFEQSGRLLVPNCRAKSTLSPSA